MYLGHQRGAEERKWLWECVRHMEKGFYDRSNIFMLAQSMLIISYVTAATAVEPLLRECITLLLSILGFLITCCWLYMNVINYLNMKKVDRRLEKQNAEFEKIIEERKRNPIANNLVLGIIIPYFILLAWSFFFYLNTHQLCWTALALLLVIVLVLLLFLLLRPKDLPDC